MNLIRIHLEKFLENHFILAGGGHSTRRPLGKFFAALWIAFFAFWMPGASSVEAQSLFGISEIRLGIFDHNVEPGNADGEDGLDVNVELILGNNQARYRNSFIQRLFNPDQHIGVSFNMDDDTNIAYAGLTWKLLRTDFMFLEASFGGAVHDGTLKDLVDRSYGCRFNFRSSGSLGFDLTPSWQLLLTVDHMSNANVCDENSGLTNAGVRLGYKLGG